MWICTTHPDNEPLTVTQNLGSGGCLGGVVDVGHPVHIVHNEVGIDNVTLYTPFVDHTIQFSFPVDFTIERANLYVHVHATIDVTPNDRRRRMLLQDEVDSLSNTAHFVGSIGVTNTLGTDDEDEGIDNVQHSLMDMLLLIFELMVISVAVISVLWLVQLFMFRLCYRKKIEHQMEMELIHRIQEHNVKKSDVSSSPAKVVIEGQDPVFIE